MHDILCGFQTLLHQEFGGVDAIGDESAGISSKANDEEGCRYEDVEDQHDPERERKLLLTKKQLNELFTAKQNGQHIIPMAMGIDHGLLKLEIGIGTSKKKYDKRETIKKREAERTKQNL